MHMAIRWKHLLQRRGFRGFVPALLSQLREVFDRRVVMLLHLGEPKTRWINIGFLGFGISAVYGAARFMTRAERDVLIFASHRLEIVPFLAADFLFAGLGGKIHVTRLRLRVSVSPALRKREAAPNLNPLGLSFARLD